MGDLVFGWRTALLSIAIAQLVLIAGALARVDVNRLANRTLALLLLALAGIVMPWAIGFAGFYDKWRWLTFAPFAIPLAVAPLLWLYVRTLIEGRWPRYAWWHLAPSIAQFAFLGASFLLPWPLKHRWANLAMPAYDLLAGLGTATGLTLYGIACLRLLDDYRRRLSAQRSDDARYASRWLSRAIGAALVLTPIWTIYAAWDAIAPLGYRGLMGLHLAIAGFALYLAVEGWRHAHLRFPVLGAVIQEAVPSRDWKAVGERWADEVREAGWASDPELTLASLARHLGTNTNYLSRALNEGLGVGFSPFVNQLRSETVAAALRAGDQRDVLDIALEAGFASKSSFNRAFLAAFGMPPSAYRSVSSLK